MFLAVGDYSIVMDNGPARQAGVAQNLVAAGDKMADLFEVQYYPQWMTYPLFRRPKSIKYVYFKVKQSFYLKYILFFGYLMI